MNQLQDEAFTQFLWQKSNEAASLGYAPKVFRQMLNTQGGYATVCQLLAKGKPSTGFTRLQELGRLDLTVEALVVESRWRSFIDPLLLRQAERLLRACSYNFQVNPSFAGPEVLVPPSPRQRRNSQSFSAFCEWLGAPLVNVADRWCGYNPERGIGVFNIWADRLQGGRYLLWDHATHSIDSRVGAKELGRVLPTLLSAGHAAYGILAEAVDIDASPRSRGYFDDKELLVLRLEMDGANIVAHVTGVVSAADVAEQRSGTLQPFDSAIDDLGVPPSGNPSPDRISVQGGTGYRRDPSVRNYVVKRAAGQCEYCGVQGFELADGTFYVEAHHVIALSARGPDTVANVIALCAEHHREAHYGKSAEALEKAFLEKLCALN